MPKGWVEKQPKITSKKKKTIPVSQSLEMINEAILALKERTGSSQIAIAKFIEEKQKPNLLVNFKKLLLVQLKKLVASGKLVKVKNSFKLSPKSVSPGRAIAVVVEKPVSAKPNEKKAEEKKKKRDSSEEEVATKENTTKAAAAAKKSPGQKTVVTPKKKEPAKVVKKPKSIKSPVKKATVKKVKK